MITEYEIHPVAKIPPPMSDEAFGLLVASIAEFGQRVPIALLDGKIVDGLNRYRACQELDIEPLVEEIPPDQRSSPFRYMFDHNYVRRQLTKAQKALMASEAKAYLLAHPEDDARSAMLELLKESNQPISDIDIISIANKASHEMDPVKEYHAEHPNATGVGIYKERHDQVIDRTPKTRDLVAQAFGVGRDALRKADTIREKSPPIVGDMVKHGKLTLTEAAALAHYNPSTQEAVAMGGISRVRNFLRAEINKPTEVVETVDSTTEVSLEDRMVRWNRAIEKWARELMTFWKSLPAGELLDGPSENIIESNLRSAASMARAAKAYAPCPKCDGEGCLFCRDCGLITRITYEAYADHEPIKVVPFEQDEHEDAG